MIDYPEIEQRIEFNTQELHKKIGQIIILNPTDSDIQEGGNLLREIWLVDENHIWWLLGTEDPNEESS